MLSLLILYKGFQNLVTEVITSQIPVYSWELDARKERDFVCVCVCVLCILY